LAVGLIVGSLVFTLPPAASQSVAVGREAGFDFLDHELAYAGGYGLVAAGERAVGFAFLDRELAYAGGYGLVAAGERAAGFDFLDHELRYAGGYGLVAPVEWESSLLLRGP
jgi:hypothetical protein